MDGWVGGFTGPGELREVWGWAYVQSKVKGRVTELDHSGFRWLTP